MSRYLDPTNDVAFKKLFGLEKHKPLLISFLNSILDLNGAHKIVEIELLPPEQTPHILGGKTSILDVKCTDKSGLQYVIEMQNKKLPEFLKRTQYYLAHTYVSQSLKGISHLELKPVILLAIANHTLFPDKDEVVSYHKTLDLKTYENDLKDFSYTFIELPKFKKKECDLVTTQDKWIYFFKNWNESRKVPANVNEPELLEAYDAMEEFNWTPGEKEAYLKANIALTEEHASKKEEFEKGHKEGKEEGLEEGRNAERRKVVKGMYALGMLQEQIMKVTHLSKEEIEELL